MEKCLLEVEARGLTEVGICKQPYLNRSLVYGLNGVPDRIAGATSEVTALKDALNRGKPMLIRRYCHFFLTVSRRVMARHTVYGHLCGL